MAKNGGGMPDGIRTVIFWALGLGVIALILIVLLILFGNLSGNFGFAPDSAIVANESFTFTSGGAIPTSAQGKVDGILTNVALINQTGLEEIPSSNYTIVGVTIIPDTTSTYIGKTTNASYTVTFDSAEEVLADSVILNYSKGATNTTAQFPTVGTILGIAVLLIVLIGVLVFAVRRLMGVTNSLGSGGGSSSSNFGGKSSSSFG